MYEESCKELLASKDVQIIELGIEIKNLKKENKQLENSNFMMGKTANYIRQYKGILASEGVNTGDLVNGILEGEKAPTATKRVLIEERTESDIQETEMELWSSDIQYHSTKNIIIPQKGKDNRAAPGLRDLEICLRNKAKWTFVYILSKDNKPVWVPAKEFETKEAKVYENYVQRLAAKNLLFKDENMKIDKIEIRNAEKLLVDYKIRMKSYKK